MERSERNIVVTKGVRDTMEMFIIGLFIVTMVLIGLIC